MSIWEFVASLAAKNAQLDAQLRGRSGDTKVSVDERERIARRLLVDHTDTLLEGLARGDDAGPLQEWLRQLASAYGRDATVDRAITSAVVTPLIMPPGSGPDPYAWLTPELRALVAEERDWRAGVEEMELARRLLKVAPALQSVADEQRYGLAGDYLVYNFLGDTSMREAALVAAGHLDEARAVIAVLEAAHSGSSSPDGSAVGVDEPIEVSFVEDLPFPWEPGAAIVDLLGPKLRTVLVRQRPSLYRLDDDGGLVHLPAPRTSGSEGG